MKFILLQKVIYKWTTKYCIKALYMGIGNDTKLS